MIRSLRGRLFLSHLLVVALALAGATILVARGYRGWLMERAADDLWRAASLAGTTLQGVEQRRPVDWVAAADRIGGDLGLRVTLIAPDGRVLGDSGVPHEQIASMDNHRARPEVAEALRAGRGTSIRRSATLNREFLYVAARQDSGPVAVVRLARPVHDFVALRADLIWQALPPTLLAALVAALLVLAITGRHAARIAELERVARRLAAADPEARAAETPPDELGRLGRAINEMAAEGRGRLDTLTHERDEHEHILAQMSDGVALIDGEGNIVRSNHSLASLLDAPRPAEPGTRFTAYARIAELHELVQRARAAGRPAEAELRLWTPRPRTLHAAATPLGEGTGNLVLLLLRDLTEIENLSRLRQDFVANVSHELRTPLTSIRGYAETLLDGALEDQQHRREFVEAIRSSSARLDALVADLLSLAELERSGAALRLEPLDLRAAAEGLVSAFRGAAERAGLELALESGPEVPVSADRPRLEQVLANLIDNAIKYTERGRVTVRLGIDRGSAWCEVADTGPGIPPDDLPRVFERFYRVDKARSREKGGTGLGLSIVKHIVALHRGEVSVRSTLGAGATFRFEIPRGSAA